MSIFKSWSFSAKLMAVNACYILPCIVLAYFLVADQRKQIDFTESERIGVKFQRPLEGLLYNASLYQVLLHRRALGDAEATDQIESVRGQMDKEFVNFETLKREEFEAMSYTLPKLTSIKKESFSVENLKADWQAVNAKFDSGSLQGSDELIEKFVDDVRGAAGYIGSTSNLILDPTADTYFVSDAILATLPQTQMRMHDLIVNSIFYASTKNPSEAQRARVQILVAQLREDLDRLVSDVETALEEDKNNAGVLVSFQQNIPIELKKYAAEVKTILRESNEILSSEDSAGRLKRYFAAGAASFDTSFDFWNKLSNELDNLLVDRISTDRHDQYADLTFALLAWLPIVLIASVILRRLSRTFITYASKLESEAALANSSSVELASASQTVSAGSTEQAAAIQETGASMSEISSMVSRSSLQAVSSQELTKKVKDQTEEGCQVIERLVTSMESIQEANAQLQNISNIISAISEKTNIINDIVGKTQLLSFNASIEAARAGQHGRGFAVVAEEVGNLAQTSGNAAKEIRSLIDDSRQQVEHILESTMARVSEGRHVTGQAQDIFTKIAADISTISSQIESISEASREQQYGIEQIAKAMAQMDQGTQLNNSAALSAARLSDQLLTQSRKLTVIAQTIGDLVSGVKKNRGSSDSDDSNKSDSQQASVSRTAVHQRPHIKLHRDSSDSGTFEHTVSNVTRKETELDHVAPSKTAAIDANDESFKKLA